MVKKPSSLSILTVFLLTSPLFIIGAIAGVIWTFLDVGWCYSTTKVENYLDAAGSR